MSLSWVFIEGCVNVLGEIDSPDTGAGADVQNTLWVFNGRKVQLVVKHQEGDVVVKIKSVQLFVVVRLFVPVGQPSLSLVLARG